MNKQTTEKKVTLETAKFLVWIHYGWSEYGYRFASTKREARIIRDEARREGWDSFITSGIIGHQIK